MGCSFYASADCGWCLLKANCSVCNLSSSELGCMFIPFHFLLFRFVDETLFSCVVVL